jgi:hypothetical protein
METAWAQAFSYTHPHLRWRIFFAAMKSIRAVYRQGVAEMNHGGPMTIFFEGLPIVMDQPLNQE